MELPTKQGRDRTGGSLLSVVVDVVVVVVRLVLLQGEGSAPLKAAGVQLSSFGDVGARCWSFL